MHRLYDWLKTILQEKINTFIKGFCGGSIVSGIFLFDNPLFYGHSIPLIVIEYLIKVIAIGLTGIISGAASIFGKDLAGYLKNYYKKFRSKKGTKNIKK